ncbi:MAG: cache domain-containing protein [Curvibacter sp.]|nr:cache domain-containing protein [Curvibacter sp.]
MQDLRLALQLLRGHGETDLAREEVLQSGERFAALARRTFAEGASGTEARTDAAAYFREGSTAIDDANRFSVSVLQRLDVLLQARQAALARERAAAVAVTVLGFALLTYLLISFYRSFVTQFREVVKVMRGIADGDLRMSLQVQGRDELAELGGLLQSMTRVLSGMVADVRSNSALVAHAGASLLSGSRELSDRTEQQAANLEETAASVEQLAGTVEHNTGIAQTANTRAAQVRDQAEAGASAMRNAVTAVEGVQQSAGKMNEIIGVIDSLAFQTNILALNAAVEAARAGEQGRGFAVVAAEVRSLAQRSAASAREIRQLIGSSSEQVERSVALIREAGASIDAITEGIRAVAGSMAEISALSAEQSSGLGEITLAVQQLDQITQRNAQMVESSVSEAALLDERASTLSASVASFGLQQGTADEAVALVRQACDLGAQAPRERFLAQVTDPSQPFHDRDLYVFVLDDSGVYRAFGGNPAKVGSRVQDIQGLDGAALLQRIIDQASQGPSWVEYDIHNPATGLIQTKMSFVQKVQGLYVGCGVYKSLQGH